MRDRFVILFLGIVVWCSCDNHQTMNTPFVNTYYNIDSLLDAQLRLLTEVKFHKKHQPEEHLTEIILEMDSLELSNAISIFRLFDINKPSLKNAYQIVDNIADSSSNLTILHYKLSDEDSNQLLKEMHFYYLDSIHNLKKIIAKSSSGSFIYRSYNLYELTFDQIYEQTLLKTYTINTTQKALFRDSIHSTIHFEILH